MFGGTMLVWASSCCHSNAAAAAAVVLKLSFKVQDTKPFVSKRHTALETARLNLYTCNSRR